MTKEILIDGVNVAECEQIFAQKKCALLDQIYCEDKQEQKIFLKELQNRWQRLMNTCKGIK